MHVCWPAGGTGLLYPHTHGDQRLGDPESCLVAGGQGDARRPNHLLWPGSPAHTSPPAHPDPQPRLSSPASGVWPWEAFGKGTVSGRRSLWPLGLLSASFLHSLPSWGAPHFVLSHNSLSPGPCHCPQGPAVVPGVSLVDGSAVSLGKRSLSLSPGTPGSLRKAAVHVPCPHPDVPSHSNVHHSRAPVPAQVRPPGNPHHPPPVWTGEPEAVPGHPAAATRLAPVSCLLGPAPRRAGPPFPRPPTVSPRSM